MWPLAFHLMLAQAPLGNPPAGPPTLAHWELAGSLASEVGGASLVAEWASSGKNAYGGGQAVHAGTGPLFAFEDAPMGETGAGGAATAQVLHVAPGAVLRVPLAFVPRGPGFIGRWTLVMDVAIDAAGSAWSGGPAGSAGRGGAWSLAPLVQANPDGDEEAELVAGALRGLAEAAPPKPKKGQKGQEPAFANGAWRRVAMVVDAEAETVALYVDGERVRQLRGKLTDSRYGLESALILFGDPKVLSPGVRLAALAVRTGVLDDAAIRRLGPATAAGLSGVTLGIPEGAPEVTFADAPATLTRGDQVQFRWNTNYAAGAVALALRASDGSHELPLGQVAMAAGHAVVWIPADFSGDAADVVLRWQTPTGAREAIARVALGGAQPSSGVVVPTGSLVVNGDFAAGLEGWTVSGGARADAGVLAGGRGDFVGVQTIDLAARGIAPEVVARGLTFTARARLKRADPIGRFGDRGTLVVRWLGRGGEELARHRSLSGDDTTWVERSLVGLVPAGAVQAVIGVEAAARKSLAKSAKRLPAAGSDVNSVHADDLGLSVSPLVPAGTVRLAKAPLLYADTDPTRARIVFEVDDPYVAPVVTWRGVAAKADGAGPPGSPGPAAPDGSRWQTAALEWTPIVVGQHVVTATLSGLEPGGAFEYAIRIGDGDASIGPWTGRLPSVDQDTLQIAWWADNQAGWKTFRKVTAAMERNDPDLLVGCGDLVHRGYLRRGWMTEWFSPLAVAALGQTTPLWVARGNHDGEHPYSYAFAPLPANGAWYAATRGNVRFIFLDTEASSDKARAQLEWLVDELASPEARAADFRIVALHKPPFANRWDSVKSKYDGEKWVRADYVPVFEKGGVDLVIGGHAHTYARMTRGDVRYVVIGGAGGYLDTAKTGTWALEKESLDHHWGWMEVSGGRLRWEARDLDGKVFDQFEMKRRSRGAKGRR